MTKSELEELVRTQKETIQELRKKLAAKSPLDFKADADEIICRVQLELLNKTSLLRELTMEETKKVEVFSKLLIELSQKEKEQENEASILSDAELLESVIQIGNKKAKN